MFQPSDASTLGLKALDGSRRRRWCAGTRAGGRAASWLVPALVFASATPSLAQDGNWEGGNNTAWDNNGRWSSTAYPNSADARAFFSSGGSSANDCDELGRPITVGDCFSGVANGAPANYTGRLLMLSTGGHTLTCLPGAGTTGSFRWATGDLRLNNTLNVAGDFLWSSTGTWDTTTGTPILTMNGAGNQNIASLVPGTGTPVTIIGTLRINNSGTAPNNQVRLRRVATPNAGTGSTTAGDQDLTVTNLTIDQGVLVVPAGITLIINGNFTMNGGTLDASAAGAVVDFRGATWTQNGGTVLGTVSFTGAAAQSIAGTGVQLDSLTINKDAGANTVTLNANTPLGADLLVQQGTLVVNGRTLTVTGTARVDGTLNGSAAGSVVTLNGGFLGASAGTVNMGARSLNVAGTTADFSGLTDFTWAAGGILTFTGGGTTSFTPRAGQSLQGVVVNKAAGADQVSLAADVSCGPLTLSQGQLVVSAGATLTVTGNATLTAGTLDASAANAVIDFQGATWTHNGGALQGAVTFTGGAAQSIAGASVQFSGLIVDKSGGAATLNASGAVGADLVIRQGALTASGAASLTVSGLVTLGGAATSGTLNLGAGGANLDGDLSAAAGGGTFNQAGAAVTLAGDLNLTGVTYQNPGPLTFDGGAALLQTVTISGATPTTFGAVTLSRTAKSDVVRVVSAGPTERFTPTDVTITQGTLDLQVHSRLTGGTTGLSVAAAGRIQNSVAGKTHEFLSSGATHSVVVASQGEFVFSGGATQVVFKEGRTVRVQGDAVFSLTGGGGTLTLRDELDDTNTWTLEVDASVAFTVDGVAVFDSLGAGTAAPLLASSSTFDTETTNSLTWILGRVWTGAGLPGNWSDPDNWTGTGVPAPPEVLIFNATSDTSPNVPNVNVSGLGGGTGAAGGLRLLSTYTRTITLDANLSLTQFLLFDGSGGGRVALGTNVLAFAGASASITGPFGGGSGGSLRLTRTGAVQLAVGAATTIDATLEVGLLDSGTLASLSTANALDVDGLVVAHGGATGSSLSTNDVAVAINGGATFNNTAVLAAGASQVSVSGAWSSGGGVTFTGVGRLTFNGGASQSVTVAAGDAFRHVTLGAAGVTQQAGSGLWSIPGSLTLTGAGTLTLGGGGLNAIPAVTVDTAAALGLDLNGAPATFGAGLTVNAGKSVRVSGGALEVQSAALTGAGSVDASGGGTVDVEVGLTVDGYTPGAVLTFSGEGDWGTAADRNYGTVVIAPGGGNTVTIQGTVSADAIDVQSGTLSVSGDRLELEGTSITPLVLTGGALTTTGTVVFQTTAADTQVPALTYDVLQLLGAVTHRPQGAVTAATFTVGAGATFDTSGPAAGGADRDLTVTGLATVQGVLTTGSQSAALLRFGGDLDLGAGQLTATAGTVRFTGGGALTLGPTASTFSILEATGGVRTVTSAAAAPLTVGSTIGLDGGGLTLGANNRLVVTGAVSIDDATLTLGALGAQFSSGISFGTTNTRGLTLAGPVTLLGDLNLANATALGHSGTLTFQGTGQTLTLSGTANTFGGAVVVNQALATQVLTVTGAPWTVTGTVGVTQGVVDLGVGSSFGGAASVGATGTLRNTTANAATHTFGAGVSVNDGAFVFTATDLTLTFKQGATVDVTSGATFTVQGAAGVANTLQDEVDDANPWTLSVATGATFNAEFLIIRDSAATGTAAPLTANNSQDAGDNTGWDFPPKTTAWRSAVPGVWSLFTNWSNGVPNSGDTVVFDGVGAPAGNGASTLDLSGLVLGDLTLNGYSGTLSLGAQSLGVAAVGTTTITTGELNVGGNRLTTGSLTLDGGALTGGGGTGVEAVSVDVTSATGTTFTFSSGTYAEGSGHLRVAGDVQATGGTWTNDTTGRLLLAGTGTSVTPQTWQGALNVGEVRIDRPAGLETYVRLASGVTALAVEVTDAETLDTGAFTLTVNGPITVTGTGAAVGRLVGGPGPGAGAPAVRTQDLSLLGTATYTEGAGDTRISGDLTLAAGATWAEAGGVLVFDGAGGVGTEQEWSGAGAGAAGVGAVRVEGGAATRVQLTGAATVTALEVVTANTFLDGGQTFTVLGDGTATPLVVGGTFTGTGTTIFTSTTDVTIPTTNTTYGGVTVAAAANYTFQGAATLSGALTVNAVGAVVNLGGTTQAVGVSVTAGALNLAGALLRTGAGLTVTGTGFTPNAAGAPSVEFTGTGTWSGVDVVTFGDVDVVGAAAVTLGSAVTCDSLQVTVGTAGVTLATHKLTTRGALTVVGAGFTPNAPGVPSVDFTGTGAWSGSGVATFGDVDVVGTAAVTLGSAVTARSLDVTVATASIGLGTHKLTTSGDLTVVGAGFTPGTGSVDFSGTGPSAWSGPGVATFGAVDVVGAGTVTLGSSVRAASLDVTAGALNLGPGGPNVLTLDGDLAVAGNGFVPNGGRLTFAQTAAWSGASVTSFGPVTVSAGTVTLGSNVAAAALTVDAGAVVTLAGSTLASAGAVGLNGELNAAAASSGLSVGGGLVVGATGTITGANLSTSFVAPGGSWTDSSPAGGQNFGPVTVSGGAITATTRLTTGTLTVQGAGASLTLGGQTNTGAVTVGTGAANTGTLSTGAGQLAVTGNVTVNAGGTLNTGAGLGAPAVALNVVGDLTVSGTFAELGAGSIRLAGDLAAAGATWNDNATAGAGVLIFVGTGRDWSGNAFVGDVALETGVTVTASTAVVCERLDLQGTAALTVGNNNALTVQGDLNGATGTLTFNTGASLSLTGSANQAITLGTNVSSFRGVTVNKAGGTATVSGTPTWTLSGALAVQGGTLALAVDSVFDTTSTVSAGATLSLLALPASRTHTFTGVVTVSGTFLAAGNGHTLVFKQGEIPGLDVTSTATFNIAGGTPPIIMRDEDFSGGGTGTQDARQWHIRVHQDVVNNTRFSVSGCDIRQSQAAEAGGGPTILPLSAANSVLDANCENWSVTSKTTTWNDANDTWADGTWNNGPPVNGDEVIFDGTSIGNSTYDGNPTGVSLTLRHLRLQAGYTGTLTLQRDLTVLNELNLVSGGTLALDAGVALFARGPTVTFNGATQGFSLGAGARLVLDGPGTTDISDLADASGGCLPPLVVGAAAGNATTLRLQSDLCVAALDLVNGTVDLNGHVLHVKGDLTLASGATWTSNGGELRFDGAAQTWTGPVNVGTARVMGTSTVTPGSDVACGTITVQGIVNLDVATREFTLSATTAVVVSGLNARLNAGTGANAGTAGVTLRTEALTLRNNGAYQEAATGETRVGGALLVETGGQWVDAGGVLVFDGGDAQGWSDSTGAQSFGQVAVRGGGTIVSATTGLTMGAVAVRDGAVLNLGGPSTLGAVTLGEVAGPTTGTLNLPAAGAVTVTAGPVTIFHGALNVVGAHTLTTGALNVGDPADTVGTSGALSSGNGQVNASSLDVNGTGTLTLGPGLGVPAAALNVATTLTVDADGVLTEGAGRLQVRGNVSVAGTWNDAATAGQGLLVLDGAIAQEIASSAGLGELLVMNAGTIARPTAPLLGEAIEVQTGAQVDLATNDQPLTLSGDLLVAGGQLLAGGADVQVRDLTVTSGTYEEGAGETIVNRDLAITGAGWVDDAGGTLVFAGGAAQSWSGAGVNAGQGFGDVRLQGANTQVTGTSDLRLAALTLNTSGTGRLRLAGPGSTTVLGTATLTLGDLELATNTTIVGAVSIPTAAPDVPTLSNTTVDGLTHTFAAGIVVGGEFVFTANGLTLVFAEAQTVAVGATGTFNVQGAIGDRNELRDQNLGGGAPAGQWVLDLTAGGTITVDLTNLRDSLTTGAGVPRTATNSRDEGNNTGWAFAAKTTQWTGLAGAGNTNWSADANWSNDAPGNGDTVEFPNPVGLVSSMNLPGLQLKELDVSGYAGGTITLGGALNVNHATSTDPINDGVFVAAGTLALNGHQLTVAQRVSVSGAGVLALGAGVLDASGDVLVTGAGSVSAAAGGGVTFRGVTQTWQGTATADFGRVLLTNGVVVTLGADVRASNAPGQTALQVADGSTLALAGHQVEVNGDLLLGLAGSAGTLNATHAGNNSRLRVTGSYTMANAGTQITSPADLLTTFAGGGAQDFVPLALDAGRLAVTGAGTQVDLGANLTCRALNVAVANARLVTQGFALLVTGPAGISGLGVLDAVGSMVATGGDMTVATYTAGVSLTFNGAGGTWSGASSFGVVAIEANVAMASAILASTVTIDAGDTLTTGAHQLTATGLVSGAGALNAATGQVVAGNGLTVTTYTPGTLLTFNGNGAWSGASNFGSTRVRAGARVTLASDVQVSGLLIDEAGEVALAGQQVQVNGDLTLGSILPVTTGRLDATHVGAASRLRVTGNYLVRAGATITAPGDLTTTFHGGVPQTFTPQATLDMGHLVATGGGTNVQLQADLVARGLTLSGAATLTASLRNLSFAGPVDLSAGTLVTSAARTVTFAGAGARDLNPGANSFPADLLVAAGAQVDVVSNPLQATGAVSIAAGATLDLQAAGNTLLDVTSPGALVVSAATTVRSIDFTGGTLSLGAGAMLTVQSTSATPLAGPAAGFTAGLGSTVVLAPQAGAPNQTVRSLSYSALTLTNAAAPGIVFQTDTTQLNVGGVLTLTAGALQLSQNLNAGSVAGAGTLNTMGLALTITAGSIANTVTLQNLTGGANLATVELLSASAIPSVTFGHLILNAGGAFSLAGGPALVVHGNLLLQGGASFSGNPQLEFRGAGSVSFAVGVATLNLGGILVQKSAFTDTVTISGGVTSNQRSVNGAVSITAGTLTLATNASFRFLQNTTVGNDPGAPGFQGRLQVQGNGVILQVGDGSGTRTLTLHDIMNVGNGNFANMQLVIGAGDRIHLTASKSQLNLNGAPSSKLQLDSTDNSPTTPIKARITVDAVTGVNAQINAVDVSVRANDASGVVNSVGQPRPIQAVSSVDRGENVNWTFEGGGALLIEAATALSDGNGRLTRVRLVYSRALNFGTIGAVHQQFSLRRVASDGTILASIAGTSANAVQTVAGRSLDVVFGSGLAQTDIQDVQVVYTPPTTSFLQSTDGVPALQTQTLVEGSGVPFVDGAPPALVSTFAQDVDGNDGLDRIVFFFSEPVAFSPGLGTSMSAFDPLTDTSGLGLNTQLTLQIAGEAAFTIDVTSFGARQSGAGIAQVIQQLVREQLDVAPPAGHDPLRRPAYRNFTAQFVGGRYLLRAGVPMRFDGGSSTYQPDFDASTVQVVSGPQDAAPQLRLGAANEGIERAGRGDALAGYSASSGAGGYNLVGATARLRLNGEDFREYPLTSNGLTAVAVELEGLVRNADNQARHPPNQDAYTQFVAIPDGTRLVLVSGTFGAGSSVVINSDPTETFSSIAQIGTSQSGAGARETVGAANTLMSLDDLSIRSQTGANLLLGRTVSDLILNGSTISIELANQPGTGAGSPTFLWADDGDLAFIADRARVPNRSSQRATNTPGSSNVVLVGDQNGDLRLGASPDSLIAPGVDHRVDASGTVSFAGTTGQQVEYVWAFDSGPATPSNIRTNGAVLEFDAVTAGTYRFRLTITTLDAQGVAVTSTNTDSEGRQVVYVEVVVSEVAPVALAGPDRVVIDTSTQLDGSQSYDPNGGVGTLTFAWQALDGSGFALAASVFNDPTSSTPTFTPGAFGTYTLRLTVSKSSTLQSVDTAQVTLADASNLQPHADAGPDQVGRVGTLITLDGSQSLDPEAAPLTYRWRVVSGPAAAPLSDPFAAQPTFLPQVPGTYVFELLVLTGAEQSMPDLVSVFVIDDSLTQARRAPAAVARVGGLRRAVFVAAAPELSPAPRVVLEGGAEREVTLIDLAANPADDPPANAVTGMTRVDVIVGTDLFASLYAALAGDDGDPRGLRVGATELPVIVHGVVASPFVLDGSRSLDDGIIETHTWRQTDGPYRFTTQTGSVLPVVPQTAGTYVFELVVTDTIGLSSFPVQVVVPVIPQGTTGVGPPAARVTVTGGATAVYPASGTGDAGDPLVATLSAASQSATFSAASSTSRGGGALAFQWTQVTGPIAVLSGAQTEALTVMPKAPGGYAFLARVSDANGVADLAIVWLTVAAPGKVAPVARLTAAAGVTVPSGGVAAMSLSGAQSTGTGPLKYLWSQRRGIPVFIAANGSSATVELTQAGKYEFILQVSDGDVVSAPAAVTVRALGVGESGLASGSSLSKSTGGCALRLAPPSRDGLGGLWFFALATLLLAVRGRRWRAGADASGPHECRAESLLGPCVVLPPGGAASAQDGQRRRRAS